MHKVLAYLLWQVVWGFPQTVLGACVLLANAGKPHFMHHGAIVTIWGLKAGLSLGPFVFLNSWSRSSLGDEGFDEPAPGIVLNDRLLVHEYGHTVQSLILGPAYLFVIGVPSYAWFKIPRLVRKRHATGLSYYAFYTEKWANHLGELVLGRPSMGQAFID